jgi:hypothetical protein
MTAGLELRQCELVKWKREKCGSQWNVGAATGPRAIACVLGARRKGDKLRLLASAKAAVPHIFRRQGGVPIALNPRRSGGPSGSPRASRYRPTTTRDCAGCAGYRTGAGHAVCVGLSVAWPARHTMMPKYNVLTAHSTRERDPGWWAIVPTYYMLWGTAWDTTCSGTRYGMVLTPTHNTGPTSILPSAQKRPKLRAWASFSFLRTRYLARVLRRFRC